MITKIMSETKRRSFIYSFVSFIKGKQTVNNNIKINSSSLILCLLFILGLSLILISCGGSSESSTLETEVADSINFDDTNFAVTDWTDDTHGKDATPNFDEIFDNNQVKRIDLVITAERWQSMLDDMENKYGQFGVAGGPPGFNNIDNPVFVPAELFYSGREWYRVGVRFKGNSSLQNSWQSGNMKLSFKLDFDQFENEYPQIENQRFYGFKKLSLKNNYDDRSLIREKIASDVFRSAGIAVSHTAFYALYLDHGDGAEYFGLYTLTEEVDDTVIKTQFSSNDGNLYKPDNGSANFVANTFNKADFEKKTNEDLADWSDIENLFSLLHADTRVNNPEQWRTEFEAIFDVDQFIQYLAVNGIIQNWDTYGRMSHNYFLYNSPDSGKLTWIPWDNNEALQDGKQGGSLTLDFSNLSGSSWPLISNIIADERYKQKYDTAIREVMIGAFEPYNMQSKYAFYSTLIEPYATSERAGFSFLSSPADFLNAVTELNSHVERRYEAASEYLAE